METHIKCPQCGQDKPESAFSRNRKRANGRNSWCKKCAAAKTKAWRLARLEERRVFERKAASAHYARNRLAILCRQYGITVERYGELLEQQGHACAICRRSFEALTTRRHPVDIDHCHRTMRVRGLLCHDCNAGLGLLQDNPGLLANAIQYLVG